ncbi:MAG: transglutaminase domain-containing protein [Oscillospiraceae bacterium]
MKKLIAVIFLALMLFSWCFIGKDSRKKPNSTVSSNSTSGMLSSQKNLTESKDAPKKSNETVSNSPSNTSLFTVEQNELNETLYYGRNSLVGNEKSAYLDIVANIKTLTTNIDVAKYNLTIKQAKKIIYYIQADYPQLYWSYSNISYISSEYIKSLSFEYPFTKEEIIKNSKKISLTTTKLLYGISKSMTDYEKVKTIHDNLIKFAEYKSSPNDQYILGILLDGYGVCASYAKTFQYLCYKVGIQSLYVIGSSINSSGKSVEHAWNIVKMDNDFYYLDVTWDDPLFNKKDASYVSHKFFAITTKQIKKTHSFSGDNYPLPSCTSTKCNYFVNEHLLFEDYNLACSNSIAEKMKKISSDGGKSIEVMFSNKPAFDACLANLSFNTNFKKAYAYVSGNKNDIFYSATYPYYEIFW